MTSVYSDDYQSVISALKQARVRQNITQTAIATALGRPQSFIAKVENGERRLPRVELSTGQHQLKLLHHERKCLVEAHCNIVSERPAKPCSVSQIVLTVALLMSTTGKK